MSGTRPRRPPILLTLVTGALGAGKTTLLNRLLAAPRFAASAVVLNEAGEVPVAGAVVERADDGIVSLSGGCICCTVRGELVEALERLLRALDNGRIERMERVLIETAGLADPAPILYLLARHPYLSLRFRVDGIVAVVDGTSGGAALAAHDENVRQVAAADRVVLSGLVAAGLRDAIRRINPAAPVLGGDAAGLPDRLAGIFDPPADDAGVLAWLDIAAFTGGPPERGVSNFSVFRDGGLSPGELYDLLDRLALDHGSKLLRLKGVVADRETPDRPTLIQGVSGLFSAPSTLARWPDGDRRSRLAVIAHDLDRSAVERLFDTFVGGQVDTPDRAALLDNPLAIPGFRAR